MTLHQFKVMDNSLILLCFLGVEFTMVCMDCVGYFKFPPCCIGEKLDVAANKCVSCPQGLLGEDCTHICNIPFNGHRCSLGGCFCTRTSCSLPADVCSSSPLNLRHLSTEKLWQQLIQVMEQRLIGIAMHQTPWFILFLSLSCAH
uniref:Uncharacterized protein LOC111102405 isoform X2 n=1 Tax=Crassostrea virginica TaxID=6565 RepID=A0A8B8AHQ3_CRAVI|nr:uncharacterized protein LOC111102405 isoform X2 [Crassostrea virginica]